MRNFFRDEFCNKPLYTYLWSIIYESSNLGCRRFDWNSLNGPIPPNLRNLTNLNEL